MKKGGGTKKVPAKSTPSTKNARKAAQIPVSCVKIPSNYLTKTIAAPPTPTPRVKITLPSYLAMCEKEMKRLTYSPNLNKSHCSPGNNKHLNTTTSNLFDDSSLLNMSLKTFGNSQMNVNITRHFHMSRTT